MDANTRVISFTDAAAALGVGRTALAGLKTLTQPDLPFVHDQKSSRRNLRLYPFDRMLAWVEHHLPLNQSQRDRLDAAARDYLPSIRDEAPQ